MTGYLYKFIPNYAILTAPLRELTHKDKHFRWGPKEQKAFQTLKDSITSEKTMAYFDPGRPIIVRTEASFKKGLAAGLFQNTDKGLQPVHFISRALTKPEKNYSQTEKDALAVIWAKNRFRLYLLGAPKFKIITAHKPLVAMFNKTTIKLPPRIEKWAMEMQDVDYKLIYEPGKNETDPLDFLSRHPLPKTENDGTEKIIRYTIMAEHAVIINRIQEETKKDSSLQKLAKIIKGNDWEKYRKDPEIMPYYPVKEELYIAENLIFKSNQIVIPLSLQRKIIKTGHQMGHLGISKTKQLLRRRYWFPLMNTLIENILGECFECKVTTKDHRQEPVKMSTIPSQPWEHISIDFGGPYPDGHYNLVAIDRRTRYPEVATVYSTACRSTTEKLKVMFATHGTPRKITSDNGPPFNSRDFSQFADEEGFEHCKVTPLHPRANGEVEVFMKTLNKTEQIAYLQGKNKYERANAVQDMLIAYRSTPHPATGITPYDALMNRLVRNKLDYIETKPTISEADKMINKKDKQFKERAGQQSTNRNTREHNYVVGDYVLLKQMKRHKWSSAYEPSFYIIFKIQGSSIGARRLSDGRTIYRDASYFKLANGVIEAIPVKPGIEDLGREQDSWRENILASAEPTVDEILEADQTTAAEAEPSEAPSEKEPTSPNRTSSPQKEVTVTPKPARRSGRTRRAPQYLCDYDYIKS